MTRFEPAAAFLFILFSHHASASLQLDFKDEQMNPSIPSPPQIYKPERPEVKYVTEGVSESLECRAHGTPQPTYRWLWNKNEITQQAISFDSASGNLTIRNFSPLFNGFYQCVASNAYGDSLSQLVQLQGRVTSLFSNEGNGIELTVREKSGIKLPCYGRPILVPSGHVTWYYKAAESKKQDQIPVDHIRRMEIDANGSLYITQTEREDQRNDYACAVTNDLQNQVLLPTTPNYIRLTVTPSTDQSLRPVLLSHTGFKQAERGGSVTLECFFGGLPPPTITWKDGLKNQPIANGTEKRITISPSGAKLRIQQLKDDDEGSYWCEASNNLGTGSASTFLNVTSRPVFTANSPKRKVATVGGQATFSCEAIGSLGEGPIQPPEWMINGEPLQTQKRLPANKYWLSNDSVHLTIVNVSKPDRLNVQCNVSNSIGYCFGDGYLTVIDPITMTSQPNRTIEFEDTWKWVNLTIVATSDNCCPLSFSWSVNGKDLSRTALSTPPYSYSAGHNTATLSIKVEKTPATEAEQSNVVGVYRCDVWHKEYSDNKTVTVTVKRRSDEPVAQQQVEAATSYWWVWIVLGIVVLGLGAFAIAMMIRYNFPRQEYLLEKEEKKHQLNPERDMLDQSFTEI